MMRIPILLSLAFASIVVLNACKHKPPTPIVGPIGDYGNFPESVGKIFITKCATAGCHNDKSYEGAGDLRLDNWEHLFSGGANGAPVVPFSTEFSPLLYFINPDSTLGVVSEPRMPKDNPALTKEEYLTIKDWIAKGAPDKNGNIPFASNAATRQKIYVTMSACDLIGVVDAEKKTIMRYIKVGKDDSRTENPHNVKFTADGKYAYVCFSGGDYLQKIDATTDEVVASIPINYGNSSSSSFNVLSISPDGSRVLVTDWTHSGRVIVVNTNTMQIEDVKNPRELTNPHGIAANASFDTFFVTGQAGNTIYRMPLNSNDIKMISLVDGMLPSTSAYAGSPNPHDLIMTPDYSKYFVTCEGSAEVRVMDAHTDKLLKVINVGTKPQELVLSPKTKTIFVTCMEHVTDASGKFKGSVYAINYETYAAQRISGKFSQPHGLSVDEQNNILYVASTNTSGPPAHHVSACAGNNGYYQLFDLNTLQPYNGKDRRYEVSVQPYSVATRFK
jgi:DNA-binding beta-propeller fold protein YncE